VNRTRLLLLGAAAAVAVVVVVVVILVASSGGGSGTTTTAGVDTTPDQAAPSALFKGVPQAGDTLGKAGAPTLLVFEDPQCPFCRDFNLDVLPTVVSDFVRTGRVKLAWRGINIIGPNSDEGLAAIYAAGNQNKLWQMAEAMYRRQGAENSGWITESVIREAAGDAGANPAEVVGSMTSSTPKMRAAAQEANQLDLRGTPSFYIQRPPGLPQQLNISSLDPTAFSAALAAALQ
jgi:protein-disulfide isomerase